MEKNLTDREKKTGEDKILNLFGTFEKLFNVYFCANELSTKKALADILVRIGESLIAELLVSHDCT